MEEKTQKKSRIVEISALLIVVLLSIAANLPPHILGQTVDRNVLLGVLGVTAVIALFSKLRFLLFITILLLALGANLPGDFAQMLGVDSRIFIVVLGVMIALSLLNYVLLLMPTGDKNTKIDNVFSRRAVMKAIKENNMKRLIRLMELNTEVNFIHEDQIPLLYAAETGDINSVEILVHYGADLDVRNEHDKTPMEVALAKGFARVAEILHYAAEGKNFIGLAKFPR